MSVIDTDQQAEIDAAIDAGIALADAVSTFLILLPVQLRPKFRNLVDRLERSGLHCRRYTADCPLCDRHVGVTAEREHLVINSGDAVCRQCFQELLATGDAECCDDHEP